MPIKSNPLTALAIEIGEANYSAAIDSKENYLNGEYSAITAYLVNVVDTARESGVSAEIAVQAFMDEIEKARALRPTRLVCKNTLTFEIQGA
jgi:hypothetical protein